ncbi:hypothetical protein ASF78_19680 [Cellulomonas sp. Leaf334]|nr:hypothetical protein ASF78_19680 [Cellulomonas sp. Leaf334]
MSLLMLAGISVATAGSAAAALPVCNTAANVWDTDFTNGARDFTTWEPVSTTATHFNQCVLYQNVSSRTAVKALQTALNACYGKGLLVDGYFGNGTRSALVAVQRSLGRNPDGVFGPDTEFWMKWPRYWADNGSYWGCFSTWEIHN